MEMEFINKKKINCKCYLGYRGKYCDRWYCNKNCNNNGLCEGPNTCHCHPLYKGEKCNMYLIDKTLNPSIKFCYHHNNSIICDCQTDNIARKYCTKILCRIINYSYHNEIFSNIFDSFCQCNKVFPEIQCCINFYLI
ncbi:hypothetical protein HZS_2275 [Henneguya salminicola]|nr:hypothetical protein HZS_2275 [Henneguya salminicola]